MKSPAGTSVTTAWAEVCHWRNCGYVSMPWHLPQTSLAMGTVGRRETSVTLATCWPAGPWQSSHCTPTNSGVVARSTKPPG